MRLQFPLALCAALQGARALQGCIHEGLMGWKSHGLHERPREPGLLSLQRTGKQGICKEIQGNLKQLTESGLQRHLNVK